MSKPTVLANAVTLVWATAYVVCGIGAMLFNDLYFGIVNTWFHGINVALIRSTTPLTLSSLIMGFITFSIFIWVITFATGSVYNMMAKKK